MQPPRASLVEIIAASGPDRRLLASRATLRTPDRVVRRVWIVCQVDPPILLAAGVIGLSAPGKVWDCSRKGLLFLIWFASELSKHYQGKDGDGDEEGKSMKSSG